MCILNYQYICISIMCISIYVGIYTQTPLNVHKCSDDMEMVILVRHPHKHSI